MRARIDRNLNRLGKWLRDVRRELSSEDIADLTTQHTYRNCIDARVVLTFCSSVSWWISFLRVLAAWRPSLGCENAEDLS